MLIHQLPPHLRNTVTDLWAPIFLAPGEAGLAGPWPLDLAETLMAAGLLARLGRPGRLACPSLHPELLLGQPWLADYAPRADASPGFAAWRSPEPHPARPTWSERSFRHRLPVLPLDRVRLNWLFAHASAHGLPAPGETPPPLRLPERSPLGGLLASGRPNLVLFPRGRGGWNAAYPDSDWWRALCQALRPSHHLLLLTPEADDELAGEADAVLALADAGLGEVAWLLARAELVAGRGGGLGFLAMGQNRRTLLAWDSLLAYRRWGGGPGHHLVFSNPYPLRYPQAARSAPDAAELASLEPPAGEGPSPGLPGRPWLWQAGREAAWDREGSRTWREDPGGFSRLARQGLTFALQALAGQLAPGSAWLLPVRP